MSEHEEIKSVADLLKRPAGTLLHAKQHLVEITATTTVVDTLKVLARHNILAVPVYDEEKKEYVGIVHTFDLLVYISFGFFQVEEKVTPESLQVHIDKLRNLPAQELIGIAHLSKAGWWHNGLNVYEPTRSIAEILSPLEGGLERVLVRATPTHRPEGPSDEMHEGHDSALRILSQSDVLRFILTHPRATQELTNKTLGQLGLTSNFNEFQKIVSVRESESALEGFRHMYTQGADAVAVVNSSGNIISTLSASDLRGLNLDSFKLLLHPITHYLRLRHRSHLPAPLTVSSNDTLQQAIMLATISHVHRLWIVEPGQHKPIAILRLTDILKAFA